MNVQINQVRCNTCPSVIPVANEGGAIRLNGTTPPIDFCPTCAGKTITEIAPTFTMPEPPAPPAARNTIQIKRAAGPTVNAVILPGAKYIGTTKQTNGISVANIQLPDGKIEVIPLNPGDVVLTSPIV